MPPTKPRKAHRTHLPGKPSKTERIRAIVAIMTGGGWVTRRTEEQLAEQWGIAVRTIRHDACEASRLIRESLANDDDLRAQLVSTLQTITRNAMNKKQLRTAVESVRVLAGVSGAERPHKVEHSGDLAGFLSLGFDGPDSDGPDSDGPDSDGPDSDGEAGNHDGDSDGKPAATPGGGTSGPAVSG